MTSGADLPAGMLWGLGALVLVLSALSARRLTIGLIIRSVISWALIAGAVWLIVLNRDQLSDWFTQAGDRLGIEEQVVAGDTVRIRQSPDGHFWARVRLNGYERRMLIDSGATMTAISVETARNAGIEPNGGIPVVLRTANGTIQAERGRAETVRLGSLETRDLPVVISPTFGRFDVIGMNFLSRLPGWRVERGTLILEGNDSTGRRSVEDAVVKGRAK